jgi:hypothetical protein
VGHELFLVSGFSRGGTNVLWNLICSHPGVLSTGIELNEIFGPSRTNIPLQWKLLIECFAIPGKGVPKYVAEYGRNRILETAERHATEGWGRWKTSGEVYSSSDIARMPVCTKSVNSWARDRLFGILKRNIALKYNRLLLRAFGTVKTLYLIRDSEAVCNGWMRRGCKPYEAGKWYRYIVETMLSDYATRPADILFVRFQDVLCDPRSTARQAHSFLGLQDLELSSFYLKSKKVLGKDGSHEVIKGAEGEMKWIPSAEIEEFLDPDVDATQRRMLNEADRQAFKRGLGDIDGRLEDVFSRSVIIPPV